jgi:hypothetical protein
MMLLFNYIKKGHPHYIIKGEVAGRLSPELGLLLDGLQFYGAPYYSKGPETRGRRLIL